MCPRAGSPGGAKRGGGEGGWGGGGRRKKKKKKKKRGKRGERAFGMSVRPRGTTAAKRPLASHGRSPSSWPNSEPGSPYVSRCSPVQRRLTKVAHTDRSGPPRSLQVLTSPSPLSPPDGRWGPVRRGGGELRAWSGVVLCVRCVGCCAPCGEEEKWKCLSRYAGQWYIWYQVIPRESLDFGWRYSTMVGYSSAKNHPTTRTRASPLPPCRPLRDLLELSNLWNTPTSTPRRLRDRRDGEAASLRVTSWYVHRRSWHAS